MLYLVYLFVCVCVLLLLLLSRFYADIVDDFVAICAAASVGVHVILGGGDGCDGVGGDGDLGVCEVKVTLGYLTITYHNAIINNTTHQ